MKSDWDKLEIDVLFDLCQRFNMKFVVIADRYTDELQERLNKQATCKVQGRRRDAKVTQNKKVAKERSVDELKQKYNQVAREILMYRG